MYNWFMDLTKSTADNDPSYIRMLRTILIFATIGIAVILIAVLINNFFVDDPYYDPIFILSPVIALNLAAIVLLQRGILWPGKLIIPFATIIAIAFLSIQGRGLHDTSVFALPLVIVLASLLMGSKATTIFSVLSIIVLVVLGIGDMTGLINHEISRFTQIDDIIITVVLIGVASGLLRLLLSRLTNTITEVNKANEELRELQEELEERVTERTSELEQVGQQIKHRAEQFEAIAQVSRVISSIQNLETLLPRIAHMISQNFGFYHVGIFLLDDSGQYAVLRAANSEGGRRMLERKHSLEVGQTGIVGYATATGTPRIALDVGADSVFFNNPDLPDTHSEMALPIKALDGQVIGALDVQSTEPNAFTQEDISILSALADQVGTAIQNAQLFESSQEALAQAELASRQMTRQAWSDFHQISPIRGYRYDGTKPEPITRSDGDQQAKDSKDAYSIPVRLRGEVVGNLRVKAPSEGYQWNEDEIAIIRATAERVALAAENARLVLESQKRASKEQAISEISSKIGSAINLDNILQTTLREMGRILPGAEISIQVENE